MFGVVVYFSDIEYLNTQFLIYSLSSWLFISFYTKYYNVYRYTHVLKLLTLIGSQFFIFLLSFFAYFSIFREGVVVNKQFQIIISIVSLISFLKITSFFLLKKYRLGGRNFRNVIVIGESSSAKNIAKLFAERTDLGYRFFGFFSNKKTSSKQHLGNILEAFDYLLQNTVDEIYCEVSSVTQQELKKIRSFAVSQKIALRLIPESKGIYSKDFTLEYYGTLPVLKPKKLPFERKETNKKITAKKRYPKLTLGLPNAF